MTEITDFEWVTARIDTGVLIVTWISYKYKNGSIVQILVFWIYKEKSEETQMKR